MDNCYCVCFCNSTYQEYVGNWKGFVGEPNTYAIIDDQGSIGSKYLPNAFVYNEAEIRKNLNFNLDVSKKHFWNSQGNKNLIWFYAHFRMLNFYKSHPHFDYYWFFDDDVKCNDWKGFFSGSKYDSDFLSYYVFKDTNVEAQGFIPKIDDKTYSGVSWFNRFPGDQDIIPSDEHLFGSFFPVVRFSNKAMSVLNEIHEAGYHGYSEGFVPTMLNFMHYRMDTLYRPDGTSRHFDSSKIKVFHKNGVIEWSWL